MKEIVDYLVESDDFQSAVDWLQDITLDLAIGLSALFFVIRFIWSLAASIFSEAELNKQKVWGSFIQGMFLVALLQVYKPVIMSVDVLMMSMHVSLKEKADTRDLIKYYKFKKEFDIKKKDLLEGKDVEVGAWDIIKGWWITYSPDRISSGILHWIIGLISRIIGIFMWLIAWISIKIFHIIGPLSIVISLIPMFREQAAKWLNGMLGNYAAIILLVILEILMDGFAAIIGSSAIPGVDLEATTIILVDLVIIAIYLSVFRYASYIVGSDVGSNIVSNLLQVANIAANTVTAIGGFVGGGKSGGTGGGGGASKGAESGGSEGASGGSGTGSSGSKSLV